MIRCMVVFTGYYKEQCFYHWVIMVIITTVDPLGMDTSLIQTVSYVPTKFSYISFEKNLFNTDPL